MHWGWYWRIKKQHTPKSLTIYYREVDSFKIFKDRQLIASSMYKEIFKHPDGELTATLMPDGLRFVRIFNDRPLEFMIKTTNRTRNFGGYVTFFQCPRCNRMVRKLYGWTSLLCRRCLGLAYESQSLAPERRYYHMKWKIEKKLKEMGGSEYERPKYMKKKTYEKLLRKHQDYEFKIEGEMTKWCREHGLDW